MHVVGVALLAVLLTAQVGSAQPEGATRDSLLRVLVGQQAEARLRTLCTICELRPEPPAWLPNAYCQQAQALADSLGSPALQGVALVSGGIAAFQQGDFPTAEERFRRADSLMPSAAEAATRLRLLNNWGEALRILGRPTEALAILSRAETLAQAQRNGRVLGTVLQNRGNVCFATGKLQEALAEYLRAQAVFDSIGNAKGQAHILTNIGNVLFQMGRLNPALDAFLKAKLKHQVNNDTYALSATVINTGHVYEELRDTTRARAAFEEGLSIAQANGHKMWASYALSNLAILDELQGNFSLALERYRLSLAMKREMGDQSGMCCSLNNLATLLQTMGQPDSALVMVRQAYSLAREIQDREQEAYAQLTWAQLVRATQPDSALALARSAYRMFTEVGFVKQVSTAAGLLHSLLAAKGMHREAYTFLLEHKTLSDSLYNDDRVREAAQQEARFTQELQHLRDTQAAEAQHAENERLYWLLGSGVLLVCFLTGLGLLSAGRLRMHPRVAGALAFFALLLLFEFLLVLADPFTDSLTAGNPLAKLGINLLLALLLIPLHGWLTHWLRSLVSEGSRS